MSSNKLGIKPIAVGIRTAAVLLDTSEQTVGYLIRTGRLPASKLGRAWRIRVEDIDALLPVHRHGAIAPEGREE